MSSQDICEGGVSPSLWKTCLLHLYICGMSISGSCPVKHLLCYREAGRPSSAELTMLSAELTMLSAELTTAPAVILTFLSWMIPFRAECCNRGLHLHLKPSLIKESLLPLRLVVLCRLTCGQRSSVIMVQRRGKVLCPHVRAVATLCPDNTL